VQRLLVIPQGVFLCGFVGALRCSKNESIFEVRISTNLQYEFPSHDTDEAKLFAERMNAFLLDAGSDRDELRESLETIATAMVFAERAREAAMALEEWFTDFAVNTKFSDTARTTLIELQTYADQRESFFETGASKLVTIVQDDVEMALNFVARLINTASADSTLVRILNGCVSDVDHLGVSGMASLGAASAATRAIQHPSVLPPPVAAIQHCDHPSVIPPPVAAREILSLVGGATGHCNDDPAFREPIAAVGDYAGARRDAMREFRECAEILAAALDACHADEFGQLLSLFEMTVEDTVLHATGSVQSSTLAALARAVTVTLNAPYTKIENVSGGAVSSPARGVASD